MLLIYTAMGWCLVLALTFYTDTECSVPGTHPDMYGAVVGAECSTDGTTLVVPSVRVNETHFLVFVNAQAVTIALLDPTDSGANSKMVTNGTCTSLVTASSGINPFFSQPETFSMLSVAVPSPVPAVVAARQPMSAGVAVATGIGCVALLAFLARHVPRAHRLG